MEIKQEKKLYTYISKVSEQEENVKIEKREMVTFFISFDIVNSTIFKQQYKDKWANEIGEILRHIISDFANSSSGGFQFWKSLGDEIIYIKNISSINEIYQTLDEVYKNLQVLNAKIDEGIICDKEAGKILAIKSTAWIATISTDCDHTGNIYTEFQINDNRKQIEFLGPDIDTGFRISQYSMKNRLVISFGLASLLYKYNTIVSDAGIVHNEYAERLFSKINIVTFKSLKGVWSNELYPIIMYHGDNNVSFKDSIDSSETNEGSIFSEYLLSFYGGERASLKEKYEGYIIDKLLYQKGYDDKAKKLISVIQTNNSNPIIRVNKLVKLYGSIICYTVDNNAISYVVFRDRITHSWSLGGLETYDSFNFFNELKEYYSDIFHVNMEYVLNPQCYNQAPLPMLKYDYDEKILGVVFTAKTPLETLEIDNEEYDLIRLVDKNELMAIHPLLSVESMVYLESVIREKENI